MKKELMQIVNSGEGMFRLNNISQLKRWTEDAIGNEVDRLVIEFDTINNVSMGIRTYDIISREYDPIIDECQKITEKYLEEVAEELNKNLRNGYRNKR